MLSALLVAILLSMSGISGARDAQACSCFIPSAEDGLSSEERDLIEAVLAEPSSVVMTARAVAVSPGQPYVSTLKPLVVYRGERQAEYEVESSDCNGIIADFEISEEWLVVLRPQSGGSAPFTAHGCSSHRSNSDYARAYEDYLASEDDSPWRAGTFAVVLVLASAAALWFVVKARGTPRDR